MKKSTWSIVPLADAVEIHDSDRMPINSTERQQRIAGKSTQDLYPYYGATGQVGLIDGYITDGEYVLLGEDGAPFLDPFAKKAYLISGKAWVNNHAHLLRSRTNNRFLCYYLNYFNYNGYVSGTTRLKLTQAQMRQIPVPVPSVPEQERIVARIEELFSQLDSGVETLKTTKQQLTVYRQAVLKVAFEGCTETRLVEQVCSHVTDGDHFPPPKANTGIPFIMISDIDDGKVKWENTHYVSKEYYSKIGEKRTPQKGDVLYTVTGSYGIPIIVDFEKEFCFQRHIALLRPNEHVIQKYLYYIMRSPYVYQQATAKATGTAQKTVALSVLRKIMIPYCSVNKQINLVSELDNNLSVCDSIEQTIDAALRQAAALRQSVLKKAFEGEL